MSRNSTQRILKFNRGRDEPLLRRKFGCMRSAPFAFFRGSCHLFYADWDDDKLDRTPRAWICGDLHLENFGAFKGDNRLVYFDLNDFDEAALAPCSWELARFATSVRLAAEEIGLAATHAEHLVGHFLFAYARALAAGKARWVERAIADGVVRELLERASGRSRAALLGKRTELRKGQRQLRIDGERARAATPAQRKAVKAVLRDFGRERQCADFFRVLDVAWRIAGTGSLCVERYIVLVEGKGSPDQNYLMDLKLAQPSVAATHWRRLQPQWTSEAERVVGAQSRCQAASPAYLSTAHGDGKSFVLRELQPTEDRLDLRELARPGRFESALEHMALLVASAHLRSSGREGSAIADAWIDFGRKTSWQERVIRYSRRYHQQVVKDWRRFRKDIEQ